MSIPSFIYGSAPPGCRIYCCCWVLDISNTLNEIWRKWLPWYSTHQKAIREAHNNSYLKGQFSTTVHIISGSLQQNSCGNSIGWRTYWKKLHISINVSMCYSCPPERKNGESVCLLPLSTATHRSFLQCFLSGRVAGQGEGCQGCDTGYNSVNVKQQRVISVLKNSTDQSFFWVCHCVYVKFVITELSHTHKETSYLKPLNDQSMDTRYEILFDDNKAGISIIPLS